MWPRKGLSGEDINTTFDLPSGSECSTFSSDDDDNTDFSIVEEYDPGEGTSSGCRMAKTCALRRREGRLTPSPLINVSSHNYGGDSDDSNDDQPQYQNPAPVLRRVTRASKWMADTIPRSNPAHNTASNGVNLSQTEADSRRRRLWFLGKDNTFSGQPPVFLGEEKIQVKGSDPIDFFRSLCTEELLDDIVMETNRYALQMGNTSFRISRGELETYLGINIIMTYIKYPNVRMYWSERKSMRMHLIADSMSRDRFIEIKKYLHFVNNDEFEARSKDKFWKVRPIFDSLHQTFHKAKTDGEHQCIDEQIVPFKGRSTLKQYMVAKPKKWGFKIWCRASQDGYVHCFEAYQGKEDKKTKDLGPIAQTVLRLCHGIEGKNIKLYMDNLFTSIPVLEQLTKKSIFVLGTLRLSRVPEASQKLGTKNKIQRGESRFVTSSDNITVLRWIDNKEVHMISTYAGAHPEDEVSRWDRKKKQHIQIKRPYVIQQYNMFMGGVDLMDRMIAHYPHGFKNKKFYLRIVFHLLNMTIVNAWILFREKVNKVPLLDFKASIAEELIAAGLSKARKRGRPSANKDQPKKKRILPHKTSNSIRYDNYDHYPLKVETKHAPRCHSSTCRRRTRYICKKCKEPVCPECMENFHTKL